MNLNSAISKARKLVKEKKTLADSNANKIIVAKEYNEVLNGELVIILYSEPH